MTAKLYARDGGTAGASDIEITDVAPFFDDNNVPLIQLGNAAQNGSASQGYFQVQDPTSALIQSTGLFLPPHTRILWTEDATGDELWLAYGRVVGGERGRGDVKGADNIEHHWTVDDANVDLRGLAFTEDWVRPAETDTARLYALQAYILNGSSSTSPSFRPSTVITVSNTHLAPNTNTFDMPAKTYPAGTQPQEVVDDCTSSSGKVYGVVPHHTGGTSHLCLLYIVETDHSTYASTVKISDKVANWDPEDLTAPVFEPHWDQGMAVVKDDDSAISGLVSRYGPDDRFVYVNEPSQEDDYEHWIDSYSDADSLTLAQATARATAIRSYRAAGNATFRVTVLMLAEQHTLLGAGMSLQIDTAPILGGYYRGTYIDARIVTCSWEPLPDGRYWAHLELNRGRRGAGGGKAQTPKPPPVCLPSDPGGIGSPVAGAALQCTTGEYVSDCGPVAGSSVCARSGVHTAISGTSTVTPGSYYSEIQVAQKYSDPSAVRFWVHISDSSNTLPSIDTTIATDTTTDCRYGGDWVTLGGVFDVPTGYDRVDFRTTGTHGIMLTLEDSHTFNEYTPPGDPVVNDPFCIPDDTGGSSPYFARSDDPRFTAADQHPTSRLELLMTNGSGVDLTAGAVVVASDENTFTTTTSASITTRRVGVLMEDTLDGADGLVAWEYEGFTAPTLTATTTANYFLYTSTTAGKATTSATRTTGCIGRVVQVDGSNLPSFVEWWGVPDSAGSYNDEAAQDAVGTILADTATVNFTYTDATPEIKADVIQSGLDVLSLGGYPGGTNTFLRADGSFSTVGADATSVFRGCKVYRSAAVQSVNNTTSTPLIFDAEEFDTDGFHFTSAAALTGTVAKTAASAAIVGTGTSFTTELSVNQVISIPGTATEWGVVKTITDNTHLTLWANMANTASGQTATRRNEAIAIPAGLGGYYLLQGSTFFAANATGRRAVSFGKNEPASTDGTSGSTTVRGASNHAGSSATGTMIPATAMVLLAEGDLITLNVAQSSGIALNVGHATEVAWETQISVTRLG